MNYGYKTIIALTLATAGMWYNKTRAQNPNLISQENTVDAQKTKTASNNDSTITFEQALAKQPTINQDSLSTANFKKFQESLEPMLQLIAHTEGVQLKAYWDPHGKIWTIGIGNTVRPDGRKVRSTDRINSKEELLKYFQSHVEKNMWNDMNEFLLIDKMNIQELAAIGSICYNCGSGILKSSKQQSELAKAINQYVLTHSKEAEAPLKELWMSHIYSRGKKLDALEKRRTLEFMILTDAISMADAMKDSTEYAVIDGDNNVDRNIIDFSKAALGGIYTAKKDTLDNKAKVVNTVITAPGDTLTDRIKHLFAKNTINRSQNRGHSR